MWRAYIAQHKYRVVLDGITDSSSTSNGLKAIRKVAEYFNSIGKPILHCSLHRQQKNAILEILMIFTLNRFNG